MNRRIIPVLVCVLAVALIVVQAAPLGGNEFAELSARYETNETDGDAEVVLFVKADEGMDRLTITDPTGRTIVDLTSTDRAEVGSGQVLIESAEPSAEEVKAAFPEGNYTFEARTTSGATLFGVRELTHTVLDAPIFRPDEEIVNPDRVRVTWAQVPGALGYLLEVENDDLGVKLEARLGAETRSLLIPRGFLVSGAEYDLGLGTLSGNDNLAVAESSFFTSGGAGDDDDDDGGDDDDDDDDDDDHHGGKRRR